MDIIVVSHTEFGFVHNKKVIFDKDATHGATEGVKNLIKLSDKYGAKITFAVCPEIVEYFPKSINHEIGLHVHPGWVEFQDKKFKWYVGDSYLRKYCKASIASTALRDYSYEEQFELIKAGKDYLRDVLRVESKVFVAGRWSINNDTVKALINAGFSHDCSALAHSKAPHYDWSRLSRISMPYHPNKIDYQKKGELPLLVIPISQYFPKGGVNPENALYVGLSWLKACFLEYYTQDLPLFHICLHSPSMTDPYFVSILDELLNFIAKHKVEFKFTSEIKEYENVILKTDIFPYLFASNRNIIKTFLKWIKL